MVSLVIQAGGESRRMGADKALLPFLGQPLILRSLSRLAALAKEVLVTSNEPENFGFLGLTPVRDLVPGVGALGGLYTALSIARFPYAMVVACDMPFASPELFAYQLSQLLELEVDAVIPCTSAGAEPFHAVYRREVCLPHIASALQEGKRRADAWFSHVKIHYLVTEEMKPYDPDGLAFFNINTPQDLQHGEEIARQKLALDK
jgi:molybdopterin-guanine dinucleotide biosynthesis protein A